MTTTVIYGTILKHYYLKKLYLERHMKRLCSNLISKNTIQTWGGVLGILLCLTACKNFLDAGKIKDEITAMIDYNNAPAYTIIVEADRASGTLIKPITGEVTKKATDVFPVKFEPNEGYKFQKWEATCTDPLSENDSISNYIVFEDETSLETNVTFKKGLKNIVIRPVCPAIPDAQVKIDGDNGNFSPSKGVYTKKAGSITSVIFDAQTDYEFIRWQIVDEETGTEIPNGKYLLLENPTESRTNFEVVDTPAPDSGIKILLQPVTMERPQVLSWGPDTENERATKDATIQVVFDRAMDENSIYYTDDEFGKIGTTNIQWWYSEKNGKPYAYKDLTAENPIKVYKNIVIRYDDDQESNINSCFGEPVFTTTKSITLPVDRTLPEDDLPKNWSSILVSFEKGFFYSVKISKDSETTKPVKMAKPKKWIYDVNNTTDKIPPVLTTNTVKTSETNGTTLSGKTLTITDKLSYTNISTYETNSTIVYTNKMYVKFALSDTNGMPKSFEMYYRKAFDEYYEKNTEEWTPKSILYHSTGKEASYENEIDFTKEEYGFDDGLYQVYFKFVDASGNPRYYPESDAPDAENPPPPTKFFNICIDTAAHISLPSQTPAEYEDKIIFKLLDDNQTLPGDFKEVKVYYKKSKDDSFESKTFNNTTTPEQLKNITIPLFSYQTYNFKVQYTDYKGHQSTEQNFDYTTKPPTITPQHLDFSNGNEFTVFDLGLSSWPTNDVHIKIEDFNSKNSTQVLYDEDLAYANQNKKYTFEQGNIYKITILAKSFPAFNYIEKNYSIFTKPKTPDVRFTPAIEKNPSTNKNECLVSYSIERYQDENQNIKYRINGEIIEGTNGTVYLSIPTSSSETETFTVEALPPLESGCNIEDSSTFENKIPIKPYMKVDRLVYNGSEFSKANLELVKLAENSSVHPTIKVLYNGIQREFTKQNLTITFSEPISVTLKPTQGVSFIFESLPSEDSNQYIARVPFIYSPTATPVYNIKYTKETQQAPLLDKYTLTWDNPPVEDYYGLQVSAEYKTSSTSDKKIIGPINIDKNTSQYVFTDIPARLSSLTFIVSTTNFAGELNSQKKSVSTY